MFVLALGTCLATNINKRANKETDLHVDSHFSRLLISLLNRYHSLELKEIGTLIVERHEAKLDVGSGLILPPEKLIDLVSSDEVVGKSILDAYEAGHISLEDWESLKLYLSKLRVQLQIDGVCSIPGIGTLTVVNDVIKLTQEQIADIGSLQPLQLKEVQVAQRTEVLDELAKSELPPTVIEEVEPQSQVQSIGKEEKKHAPYRSAKSSVGSMIKVAPESPWYHHVIPLMLLISGVVGLVMGFRYCNVQKTETTTIFKESSLERMPDDVDPLAEIDTTRLFDHPYLDRYRDVLTQEIINDGCKIAVGSFKKRENAVNMKERIVTEGYDAAIIDSDKGSRVVVQFDCLEYDLIDFLKIVQKDISAKAWYYQPRFESEL